MFKSIKLVQYRKRFLRHSVLAVSIALGIAAPAVPVSGAGLIQFDVTIARASNSGRGGVDKQLIFAKKDLLGRGYENFSLIRRYRFKLAKGRRQKFSVGRGVSALLAHAGVIGRRGQRVQYYLDFYSGNKKAAQARVYYTVERGKLTITGLPQPGGWAYMVIVRPLK